MPPVLALLAYAVFVAWCFRTERGHFNKVGSAVWLPTIWMLYVGSKPLARWLEPYIGGDATDDSGSAIDRYFLTLLICVSWVILLKRQFTLRLATRQNPWLLVLLGYMLISVLWSDVPGTAFKRWVRELGTVSMALVLLTEPEPKEAIERVLRRSIILLVPLSLVLIKYFPELGIQFHRWTGERMWVGVTLQKNGIGRLCLIAAFYLIWSLARHWRGKDNRQAKSLIGMEVLLLLLTMFLLKGPSTQGYSATAVVSLSVGLMAFAFLSRLKKHPRLWPLAKVCPLVVALGIATGVAVPLVLQESSMAGAATALGRDATFTGRTEIWAGLIPEAAQHPLLGHGFGSFWTGANQEEHRIGEAHNGYLDMRLELGWLGILLVAGLLVSSCRTALRLLSTDFYWAIFAICLILMAVVHNLSESSINSFTSQLMALVIFTVTSLRKDKYAGKPQLAQSPIHVQSGSRLGHFA